LELLEERNDALILLDETRKLRVVEKNPYTLLKYKYYQGKKIRFLTRGANPISLVETDTDGVFECTFDGMTLNIADSPIQLASAIIDAHEKGNLDVLYSLWRLKYAERFLDIRVNVEGNSPVELTRDGKLVLPKSILLQILESVERQDGGRVVKVVLSSGHKSPVERIFTHEVQVKGRTKVIVNDTAVALIGRDETKQCWMHVVPPEYRDRSIGSCEMWLSGGEEGKDELMDSLDYGQ
jgi:hypothetical protein